LKKAVRIVYTAICVAAVVAGSAGLTQRARQTEPAPAPEVEAAVPVFAETEEPAPVETEEPALPRAVTREEAAMETYAELLALGVAEPAEAASIAVFADAAEIAPEARTAVARLCAMGVMPVGGAFFRPKDALTEDEAALLANNAALAASGELDPLAALGAEREVTLEACRAVCSAMLALDEPRFEGAPDARLAYETLARCAGSGLYDCSTTEEGFEFRREAADAALARIFAAPAPDNPDPTASDPPPRVLGDVLLLPAPEDRIELSPGAVVPDGEGGARIWCTVYEDGHYCCCALIFLAEGGRLSSAELSFG
jgi:hypothetical protein